MTCSLSDCLLISKSYCYKQLKGKKHQLDSNTRTLSNNNVCHLFFYLKMFCRTCCLCSQVEFGHSDSIHILEAGVELKEKASAQSVPDLQRQEAHPKNTCADGPTQMKPQSLVRIIANFGVHRIQLFDQQTQ